MIFIGIFEKKGISGIKIGIFVLGGKNRKKFGYL